MTRAPKVSPARRWNALREAGRPPHVACELGLQRMTLTRFQHALTGGTGLMRRSIGIVLFPDVAELAFVGRWQVFAELKRLEPEACRLFTVSESGGEVPCAGGLRVRADHALRQVAYRLQPAEARP